MAKPYRKLRRAMWTILRMGVRNRLLAFGVRLAPRRVVTQIARRMNES